MTAYTVIGVWINDEFYVAGVAAGDIQMVDQDPYIDGVSRFAESIEADSPEEAERLICEGLAD